MRRLWTCWVRTWLAIVALVSTSRAAETARLNAAPGWGIDVDENLAAKFPYGTNEQGERGRLNGGWGDLRLTDGTVIKQ
jgi:hypothetical protein